MTWKWKRGWFVLFCKPSDGYGIILPWNESYANFLPPSFAFNWHKNFFLFDFFSFERDGFFKSELERDEKCNRAISLRIFVGVWYGLFARSFQLVWWFRPTCTHSFWFLKHKLRGFFAKPPYDFCNERNSMRGNRKMLRSWC